MDRKMARRSLSASRERTQNLWLLLVALDCERTRGIVNVHASRGLRDSDSTPQK